MKIIRLFSHIFLLLYLLGCNPNNFNSPNQTGPSKVEIRLTDGLYRLYVDGEEFFVKGAGCECWEIESLAKNGANAFRTWMDSPAQRDGLELLDEAQSYGLKVLMGINMGRERHGFNYDDQQAVEEQKRKIRNIVLRYKDHPALLGWGIGNELNLHATNMKVWDAVNDISKMIHEIDGNHPTTTMLAGISKRDVTYLEQINSDLDFLSVQMYADIVNLDKRLEESGYDGPYLITEWGATGHWEVALTDWNVAIEPTSSEKADAIKHRYENVILKDRKNCMGSFVFLWGQKQERTPTWYGLFTENGEKTEAIDVMYFLWNNEWPENRAPRIIKATLDNKDRFDNIRLNEGNEYMAYLNVADPDKDPLEIRWEILKESKDLKDGGDLESRPGTILSGKSDFKDGNLKIAAPSKQGAYRLFIYILDGNNHAATVNFPFLVE
jgi:hypothetical protein